MTIHPFWSFALGVLIGFCAFPIVSTTVLVCLCLVSTYFTDTHADNGHLYDDGDLYGDQSSCL